MQTFILRIFTTLFVIITVSGFSLGVEDIPIVPNPLNKNAKRKSKLALCSLFRDEADYLKEWIEYHRLVGVTHFYLYNNLSVDDYWTVLKPYVEAGIVELFDVPFESNFSNDGAKTHNFVQVCCYNHAINASKNKFRWLAIVDSDEFVTPMKKETLTEALADYDYAAGIAVYWLIYGTSNVWELQSEELMLEKLTHRQINRGIGQFKSIVNPKYAKCHDPHWSPSTDKSKKFVIETHQDFSHTRSFAALPVNVLRITHYHFRTESFFWNVKRGRRAQWGFIQTTEEAQNTLDDANREYDPTMLRFVERLRLIMFP